MPDVERPPAFAIVGHPNEGKSSVVATLAEDDRVRISNVPGETVVCREYPVTFNDLEILRFVDTPGFQHPQAILEWIQARGEARSNPAADFIAAYRDDPAMAQDVELMRPLADGSGVIYVVDGSRPVRAHDRAEMEILRLTGNPRMAVINPKEASSEFLEEWKAACARCFNSTRVFNALQASYAERIALLESLKSIHQDWEPALNRAVQAFREDWTARNARVAGVVCDLLRDALTHVEKRSVFQSGEDTAARNELVAAYQESIRRMEERAQAEVRRLFRHNIFRPGLPEESILHEDLFTERTWQFLGLNRQQILLAAAALGAGVGVQVDLLLGHLSLGLFAASGAVVGAAAAWLQGESMARASVKHLKLGGVQITVGPNRNPQFPFVLVDRLLLYYQHTINWTHARRDRVDRLEPERAPADFKLGFTAQWSRDQRRACVDFVQALASGNRDTQDTAEKALQAMLSDFLMGLSTRPR